MFVKIISQNNDMRKGVRMSIKLMWYEIEFMRPNLPQLFGMI